MINNHKQEKENMLPLITHSESQRQKLQTVALLVMSLAHAVTFSVSNRMFTHITNAYKMKDSITY